MLSLSRQGNYREVLMFSILMSLSMFPRFLSLSLKHVYFLYGECFISRPKEEIFVLQFSGSGSG
jgi:hypothetical protein